MTCAVALWSVAAACGTEEAAPVGTYAAEIATYQVRFEPASKTANATLLGTASEAGNCFTLPFRGAAITAASLNGKPASVTWDGASATFCGAGVATGAALTLEVAVEFVAATEGASQIGFSTRMDKLGKPFTYLVSWVGGCDRFFPCDNHPARFATYHFEIVHAAGTHATCVGTRTEVSATETHCDFGFAGGPTYSSVGFATSPSWTTYPRGLWHNVNVTVYDRPDTKINTRINDAYHAGFIAWMTEQFGPYPYGDALRIYTAPTYWSGFEHPGNIILSDGLATRFQTSYADDVAHVLNHEIAHQWAGNQTTLADTYDFVWKEAMAEYLTYVYEAQTDAAVAQRTAAAWKNFASVAKYFPVPGDKPALFAYYGDVYGAGPMVLFRQLEVLTSRDQVLAALRAVLGKPRALAMPELLAALAQASGKNLDAYAAAWVYGTGKPAWPQFQATFTPGATGPGGMSSLTVEQTNAAQGAKPCAFHVALRGANPDESTLVPVDLSARTSTTVMVATPPFAVTATTIDPLHECLGYTALAAPPAVDGTRHPWQAP